MANSTQYTEQSVLSQAFDEATLSLKTTGGNALPVGAVAKTATSGNVANAAAVATLAAVAAKLNYITNLQMTAAGATAASVVTATVTGLITGTQSFTFVFPAGATVAATPLIITFPTPIPASAVNTAIVVTLGAGGVGNTNAAVNAQGFHI